MAREWRPHPLMRAGGVLVSGIGLFLIGMMCWAAFFTSKPTDKIPVNAAIAGMFVGVVVIVIGYLFTFRYRIAIADDTLIIVNLFTDVYPLGHVASAKPGRTGIVFTMYDWTHCVASAVETGLLAQSLKRRTRADEVIEAVMAETYRKYVR